MCLCSFFFSEQVNLHNAVAYKTALLFFAYLTTEWKKKSTKTDKRPLYLKIYRSEGKKKKRKKKNIKMEKFMKGTTNSLLQALKHGPLKVSIVGSGNWGCVIGGIMANNAKKSYIFCDTIKMWVHPEQFEGRELTEIINTEHENKKYLPNIKLPTNLVATSNLIDCVKGANMLVFVLPHQFIYNILKQIKESNVIFEHTKAISLIKGIHVEVTGKPKLFSQFIQQTLGIDCCVLSGANVAGEVARQEFCESTIGFKDRESAIAWQQLFHTNYFRINCIPDVYGVEICGALKNVIALSAGFCDGMKLGTNTKSAIIRIGFEELKKFAMLFFDNVVEETFFDSAGMADVITTCFAGRNVKCAAEFVAHGGKKSWEEIEAELLNGQKLQGTLTVEEVYTVISKNNLEEFFPLYVMTYKVAFEGADPRSIVNVFQDEETQPIRLLSECNLCVVNARLASIKSRLCGFHSRGSVSSSSSTAASDGTTLPNDCINTNNNSNIAIS